MQFIFADTLHSSIAKLHLNEAKQTKTTLYDLQINPTSPGLSFHRVERARDPNFWSIRVNQDIRIIIHRTNQSFVVCYADHHDNAYRWAENRKGMVHPTTGAFQFVKIRECVEEVVVKRAVKEYSAPPIFDSFSSDDLLGFGIPEEWLQDVMNVTDDDDLLALIEHLPAEETSTTQSKNTRRGTTGHGAHDRQRAHTHTRQVRNGRMHDKQAQGEGRTHLAPELDRIRAPGERLSAPRDPVFKSLVLHRIEQELRPTLFVLDRAPCQGGFDAANQSVRWDAPLCSRFRHT